MKKSVLCFLAALCFYSVSTARAVYVLTLQEVGPDVVATGSGSINTADLLLNINGGFQADLTPASAQAAVGQGIEATFYLIGGFGPNSFGPGTQEVLASSVTGDATSIFAGGVTPEGGGIEIAVPVGYTSGSPLAGTATFDNASFTSLGFTPGTYVNTWGTGAGADSFTIVGAVPEPSTWAMLGLGAPGVGIVALRRRRALA